MGFLPRGDLVSLRGLRKFASGLFFEFLCTMLFQILGGGAAPGTLSCSKGGGLGSAFQRALGDVFLGCVCLFVLVWWQILFVLSS